MYPGLYLTPRVIKVIKPEMKYTNSGKEVTNFSTPIDMGKDKDANWVRCTAWGKLAELINSRVAENGRIEVESWSVKFPVNAYQKADGTIAATLEATIHSAKIIDWREQVEVDDSDVYEEDELPFS